MTQFFDGLPDRLSNCRQQHRWLKTHPQWLCHFKLEKVPSRATLSRRYKQLADLLEAFIVYLGDVGMPLIGSSSFIKTKACLRQKAQSGIRKTEMPITFQRVYTRLTHASWSKSHYHGWVYGYGLHLTVSPEGVPRMGLVDTACVSEKAGLDRQTDKLLERNIGYTWLMPATPT